MAHKYPLLLVLLALAGCSVQAGEHGAFSEAGAEAADPVVPVAEHAPGSAGASPVVVESAGATIAEAGASEPAPELGGSGGSTAVPALGGAAGEPGSGGAGLAGLGGQGGTAGTGTSMAGAPAGGSAGSAGAASPPDNRPGMLSFYWTGGCEAGSGGQVTVHLLDASGAPYGSNGGDFSSRCELGAAGITVKAGSYSYSVKLVEMCVDPVTYERVHCVRSGTRVVAPAQTLDVQLGAL